MHPQYCVAMIVLSLVLTGPSVAQQPEQNRPAAPQARPPAAAPGPASVADAPNVPPPSPAMLESQRRRDENSVDLDELLERNKSHLVKLGPGLPDNGEKIRLNIASLEAEKQRRVLHRSNMVRILTTTSLISFFLSCLFFLDPCRCWGLAKTLSFYC